jgi:hypothetical protein
MIGMHDDIVKELEGKGLHAEASSNCRDTFDIY